MPIYEYFCNQCHKRFVLLQKVGASEENTVCTFCNSPNVKKLMSAFSSTGKLSGGGVMSSGSF
jgi:putative FmdB family regulatory protein